MLFSALGALLFGNGAAIVWTLILGGTIAYLATLYVRLLPKPIPGDIPYNKSATRSIWGDMWAMYSYKHGHVEWLLNQARTTTQGPIRQVLVPFTRPFVMVADYRETYDITYRRTDEFDRSFTSAAFFGVVCPNFHMNLKVGPKWKAQRRLIQDLVSPAFLKNVAASSFHDAAMILIDLWKEKTRIADGKPISVAEDLKFGAFDAILALTLGPHFSERALNPQLAHLRNVKGDEAKALRDHAGDEAMHFEHVECHPDIEINIHMTRIIDKAMSSLTNSLLWGFTAVRPAELKMAKRRNEMFKGQVMDAVARMEADDKAQKETDAGVLSAVDLITRREREIAQKDGREPMYWSDSLRDELLGFLVAGHDTTATSVLWGLKWLSDYQGSQKTLLEYLERAYPEAKAEGRAPTPHEINGAHIPYFDAFIEETLRLAGTVPGVERETTKDTTILGHFVPKGTLVLMLNRGPSYTEAPVPTDETKRSETAKQTARDRGVMKWDNEGIDIFRPERWLKEENGELVFDHLAGPTMPFGGGLRGCFGKKLAYLELKVFFTLLVWHLDFQHLSPKFSGNEAIDSLTHAPKKDFVSLRVR